jgi:hypothetical protein
MSEDQPENENPAEAEDEDAIPGGGIRRVTSKDRKRRLDPAGPLFVDDEFPPLDADTGRPLSGDDAFADLPVIPVDDVDDVEDEDDDVFDVDEVEEEPAAPPRIYTPPDERFPPVHDTPPAPAVERPSVVKPAAPPQPPKKRGRRRGDWRHNVAALFFSLATVGMLIYFVHLWNNPWSSLNPLPPITPFIIVTVTPDPMAEVAARASETAAAIPTLAITPATAPATGPTPDPGASRPPFTLSGDGVIYTPNNNGRGCDWASIAGTVTGLGAQAINNYGIQVTDIANPDQLDDRVFSGSAQTFGPGGFEIPLGGVPQEVQYRVQLFSPAGAPVSDPFFVVTSSDCDQNVAIINFVQVRDF